MHHYSNPDPISDLTDLITPAFGQYSEPQDLGNTITTHTMSHYNSERFALRLNGVSLSPTIVLGAAPPKKSTK
jgi:hypothetical protein